MTPSFNQTGMAINVGAFVLILGISLFSPKPLESVRPKFESEAPQAISTFGTIRCREWEDPVEAVRAFFHLAGAARKSAASKPTPRSDTDTKIVETANDQAFTTTKINEISGTVFTKDLPPVANNECTRLFLPIFVRGDSYPEGREMRLRSRYAMQAALTSSGYRSVKSNFLYYFEHLQKRGEGSSPYGVEIFTRDPAVRTQDWTEAGLFDVVVVAWLDSDLFDLCDLTTTTEPCIKSQLGMLDAPSHIVHLGGSDALAKVISTPIDPALEIWFPRSTASFHRVLALAQAATPERSDKELQIDLNKIRRPQLKDDDLLKAVAKRLRQFIPGFHPQRDTALVAEWDTGYARGMVEAWHKIGSTSQTASETDLRVFSYLRGLDGNTTAKNSSSQPDNALQMIRRLPNANQTYEHSADATQFDYLRRLASSLATDPATTPRAIGIIGSDIYDKITVLQAMKPLLPGAVFFTTDADQLLVHPSTQGAAKNLIVASMNDMTPPPMTGSSTQATQTAFGQIVLPKFRDTYQVELLKAVQEAIMVNIPSSSNDAKKPDPVVIEVGNHMVHEVKTGSGNCGIAFMEPLGLPIVRFAIGLLMVAAIISYARYAWAKEKFMEARLKLRNFLLATGLLIALVGAVSELSSYSDLGAHLDGVSAFGSQLLLLGSFATCYFGIRSIHQGMTHDQLGNHTFQAAKIAMLDVLKKAPRPLRYLINCDWLCVQQPGLDLSQAKNADDVEKRFAGKYTSLVLIFACAYTVPFILVFFLAVSFFHKPQPLMGSAFSDGFGVLADTTLALFLPPLFVWLVFCILAWHLIVGLAAHHYRHELIKENFPYESGNWEKGEAEHHRLLQLNELFGAIRLRIWFPVTALFLFALSRAPLFQSAWWASGLFLVLLILIALLFALPVWAGVALRGYRDEILWHIKMYELRGLDVNSVQKPNPETPMTCPNWELLRVRNRRPQESATSSPSWVKRVTELDSGALEPWFSQPVVQSIITLIIGLSAIKALDPLVQFLRGG